MKAQRHKSLRRERKFSFLSFALVILMVAILGSLYKDSHMHSIISRSGKDFVKAAFSKFTRNNQKNLRKGQRKKESITDKNEKLIMTFKSIKRLETAVKKREGGGFMVRRPVGDKIDAVDPFLLLDHLGPVVYRPGEAIGAPDHPHRGFETVTYVIDGKF